MSQQFWNPNLYEQKHSYVYSYGEDLISLLGPQKGERIIDLGCGTGHLTQMIAEAGAQVTGLDSSPSMIEAARRNHPHLEFVLADATAFSFPSEVDAVFSNAALHWVLEAEKAVCCISNTLKTGGRFVAEFGGKGNIARVRWAIENGLRDLGYEAPNQVWYFPSIGDYSSLLEKHHLSVRSAWLFDRPTKVEGEDGLKVWIEMFGVKLLDGLTVEEKQRLSLMAEESLRGELFRDGNWYVDYRRLRIFAEKE